MREARELYAALGARPVINALGNRTMLGGSNPAPEVLEAMQLSARYYVDMVELFEGTGRVVSGLLGCEAALVTPGCAAALVLGTSACMTGTDTRKMDQLPDTAGLKSEVVLQKAQRYKYDRVVRLTGARIVEAGSGAGTTRDELEAAFGPGTAAVLYPAIDNPAHLVSLEETLAIARERGVPVIVDAAYRVYPVEGLRQYTDLGADLVGYGAKYFGAPNSAGLLCGREDLVEAARLHSFASFEKLEVPGVGRPLKIDRQEVVGAVAALRLWLEMDHGRALRRRREEGAQSRQRASGTERDRAPAGPRGSEYGHPAAQVGRGSASERPRRTSTRSCAAATRASGPTRGTGVIRFFMFTVEDGDELVIAERLRELLG